MAETDNREFIQKFYNLSNNKCEDTIRNKSLTATLLSVANECRPQLKSDTPPPHISTLLYNVAAKLKGPGQEKYHGFLIKYILSEKIKTDAKLNAAIQFLKSSPNIPDTAAFDTECGIGVEVTRGEVEAVVDDLIGQSRDVILERRYKYNTGEMVGKVRALLKWADGKLVKEVIDAKIQALLGKKTTEDDVPRAKEPKKTAVPTPTENKQTQSSSEILGEKYEIAGEALAFHKTGENYKTEGYVVTPYTMSLIEKHLEETGGQVITRFPPEPNGILHIGHAKAINFNFGYAKAHDGITYLRYDDTNPEKEEERFFREIKEMVEWLGHKPYKVTHASDNFQQLYEWAVKLIRSGNAYIDHQKQTEIQGMNVKMSPWRDRPMAESLKLFEDMKNGLVEEGKATLRMKHIMEDGKVDPVGYRIKFTPHPRSGDKWCIYPTYDYTHCLCDSIENITHSLCTKEFQSRRSAYYWLCNALNLYCPVQWEYSRLNLTHTVVSKRKILKLIQAGIVKDWDDPRLFTLTALRRRGVPPEAINRFCSKVGVTMTQTVIEPGMLDACISEVLDITARRVMCILDPIKVSISNFPQKEPIFVDIPDFPRNEKTSYHKITFEKVIYIDRSDVCETPSPDFRRLAKGQAVGLRHTGFVIRLDEVCKDGNGDVTEVKVNCLKAEKLDEKPRAWIHWVSRPVSCEVRLYDKLFLHATPEDAKVVPGGFITDCNQNSLNVVAALIDTSIEGAKPLDKFQFERVGFFAVDLDSTPEKLVFNRTISLKEGTAKTVN